MEPLKVIIASTNPVKINATKEAFTSMFPNVDFAFDGVSVPSNVSDQPMSEAETTTGARNRALNAKKENTSADYWVGIEGGIEVSDIGMETFAWMVVIDKQGTFGYGRTGSFFLPPKVAELVESGLELGDADDQVFGMENSKQANGAVGILTEDRFTRTSFYVPALTFALIPFKNPKLYSLS